MTLAPPATSGQTDLILDVSVTVVLVVTNGNVISVTRH